MPRLNRTPSPRQRSRSSSRSSSGSSSSSRSSSRSRSPVDRRRRSRERSASPQSPQEGELLTCRVSIIMPGYRMSHLASTLESWVSNELLFLPSRNYHPGWKLVTQSQQHDACGRSSPPTRTIRPHDGLTSRAPSTTSHQPQSCASPYLQHEQWSWGASRCSSCIRKRWENLYLSYLLRVHSVAVSWLDRMRALWA